MLVCNAPSVLMTVIVLKSLKTSYTYLHTYAPGKRQFRGAVNSILGHLNCDFGGLQPVQVVFGRFIWQKALSVWEGWGLDN